MKLSLPKIGFGGAPIGNLFRNIDDNETNEILDEAFKNKINYFDTSPLYGCGLSEIRIGQFIEDLNRKNLIISSKVGRYLVEENTDRIDRGFFKSGLNYKTIFLC